MMRDDLKNIVISIAGGASQVSLIQKLSAAGYAVLVADRDALAPGFAYADYTITGSTHDPEAILGALYEKGVAERVATVITKSSGLPVYTAASVAEALRIPFIPKADVKNIIHKSRFLPQCRLAGIRCPSSIALSSRDDLGRVTLPAVIKPSLSHVSKQGITLVESEDRLIPAYEAAARLTVDGVVNAEEYLKGRVLAAIYLNEAPVVTLRQLNEGPPLFKNLGFVYDPADQNNPAIASIVSQMRAAFGIENALLQLNLIEHNGLVSVVELHVDFGGDYVFDVLLGRIFTEDVYEMALRSLIDRTALPALSYPQEKTALRFIYSNELELLPVLEQYGRIYLEKPPGSTCDAFERAGYWLGSGRAVEAMERLQEEQHRVGLL